MSNYESAAEIRDELTAQTRAMEFSGALPLPTVFGEVFVAPRAVAAVSTGPEGRGVRVHIGGGTSFDISKKDAPRATPRSVALYLARGGALEPFDAPKAADESRAAAAALLAALDDPHATTESVRDAARRLLDLLPVGE